MKITSVVAHVVNLTRQDPRPWLIVGKGPTAAKLGPVEASKYHVLTLNDACRLVTPAVAHFVDVEAVERCLPVLKAHVGGGTKVAVPWHPHINFKPGYLTLPEHPWFGQLHPCVLSYNATTGRSRGNLAHLPWITLRAFSAVAAFNILVTAGEKHVYSVGVDGGSDYALVFDPSTKLANGQKTFDVQGPHIHAALARNGTRWTRLHSNSKSTFEVHPLAANE